MLISTSACRGRSLHKPRNTHFARLITFCIDNDFHKTTVLPTCQRCKWQFPEIYCFSCWFIQFQCNLWITCILFREASRSLWKIKFISTANQFMKEPASTPSFSPLQLTYQISFFLPFFPLSFSIGELRNVFKFHAHFVNKRLLLTHSERRPQNIYSHEETCPT